MKTNHPILIANQFEKANFMLAFLKKGKPLIFFIMDFVDTLDYLFQNCSQDGCFYALYSPDYRT